MVYFTVRYVAWIVNSGLENMWKKRIMACTIMACTIVACTIVACTIVACTIVVLLLWPVLLSPVLSQHLPAETEIFSYDCQSSDGDSKPVAPVKEAGMTPFDRNCDWSLSVSLCKSKYLKNLSASFSLSHNFTKFKCVLPIPNGAATSAPKWQTFDVAAAACILTSNSSVVRHQLF